MQNIETLFKRINREFQLGDNFEDPMSFKKIERKGLLKLHPDKNGHAEAKKMFQVWNSCKEVIKQYHPSQRNRSGSFLGR